MDEARNSVIQILDPVTSNQIAAGEVVERPVSVVKELVENAIDAGARRIVIKIKQDLKSDCLTDFEISDDGCGMSRDDLMNAFYRHATSKLRSIEDLDSILSLGFRGEALPSIASVSRVTIQSRAAESLSGFAGEVVDGRIRLSGEVGMPVGTKITVSDLFYNTPARRKFLKSAAQELGLITSMVGNLILSAPQIAFVLKVDERTVLHSAGSGDLRQAVISIYGANVAANLAVVDYQGKIKVNGFVSMPPFARSNRKYCHFYVNGRLVKSRQLQVILEACYDTLLPERKYPFAVLYLLVDPKKIDVNVHPAKTEIRFRDLAEINAELSRAVSGALRGTLMVGSTAAGSEAASSDEPQARAQVARESRPDAATIDSILQGRGDAVDAAAELFSRLVEKQTPKIATANPWQLFKAVGSGQTEEGGEAERDAFETVEGQSNQAAAGGEQGFVDPFAVLNDYLDSESEQTAADPQALADLLKQVAGGETEAFAVDSTDPAEQQQLFDEPTESAGLFQVLRPLGQINASYIAATYGEDLYIIDQHAAHERILFEDFCANYEQRQNETSMLAVPVTIELGNLQKELLLQNLEAVTDFGFMVEYFGDSTFIVRGVPIWYSLGHENDHVRKSDHFSESIEEFFLDIMDKIIDNARGKQKDLTFTALNKEELFTMACKAAVKANWVLTAADINWLLQRLATADKPQTCPHGRPTIIKIDDGEIRKRFLRS